MTTGLGLGDFLNHNPREQHRGGARGDFLQDWKKPPKGKTVATAVMWLHTGAKIYYANRHNFLREIEVEDKDTKQKKPMLVFPKFVSPDPVSIHVKQYFREDDDRMQEPPDRDPFLILREWLRAKGQRKELSLDTVVFEWTDYGNNNLPIRYLLKHLAKLEKTGKSNFRHTLDSKEAYLFTVVSDANPTAGPKLTWETKLVGEKLSEVINQEKKSKGEAEGDPAQWPYAFCWEYHSEEVFQKSYKVYRFDKAAYTDQIEAAVYAKVFPDGSKHALFAEADLKQMRDDFEAAMQINLPLDLIFSTEKEDRMAAVRGEGGEGSTPKARTAPARPAPAAAQERPAAAQGATPGRRPTVGGAGAPAPAQQAQGARQVRSASPAPAADAQPAASTSGGGRTRRAVNSPPPPPPPKQDTTPCETCKKEMPLTALKCPHCGQEYEPVDEGGAEASSEVPAQNGESRPCIYCSGRTGPAPTGGGTVCIEQQCGLDQGDDIPFN